jgi:pilus assembly protein CpaC
MKMQLTTIVTIALFFGLSGPAVAGETEEVILLEPSRATGEIRLSAVSDATDLLYALDLERGKSVFMRTDYNVKRVAVGDPAVLDVLVLSPQELQFVAKSPGSTNVLVWDSRGRPQASIEVRVGTPQSYLQEELRRLIGAPEIEVHNARAATVLRGSVPSPLAAEQAVAVANAFVSGDPDAKVVNLLEVGGNQQVMLKVVIAEMSRTLTREFGTNFNALIDAGSGEIALSGLLGGLTSPGAAAGDPVLLSEAINLAAGFTNFGGLEQLAVFFDILDQRGLTKILAEPALVARSGDTAHFLVGGEVPIPVAQGGAFGSITVEYKSFGVGLSFTPTILGPDRIHLKVSPEVSQPDFTFGTEVEGTVVPAFNARRASTSVELSHGQSLAIAGLLNEELREQVSRYPLLGQIPVIGGLFRSSRFQKNQTELVIIVTPQLVNPLGDEPVPLPTDYFVEPSSLEFYALGSLEGRAPQEEEPAGLIGDAGYRISPEIEENTND